MIDITVLGLLALSLRIAAVVLLISVLINQLRLRLRAGQDELNGFRNLLIALTVIPLLFNFISMYNNYIRVIDGQQNEVINSISFVMGAVASTCTALVLWLLYRKR